MRTVGQILKEEREKKFYTIEEIEKATKIRKELLKALEADEYSKLPPPTFVQGFIKNYGKFLGLDTERLLAIFRREFSERKNPPQVLDSLLNPLVHKRFHLTPTTVLSIVVIGLVIAFFTYLWSEYRNLAGAPTLQVDQPQDQIIVENDTVEVTGKVDLESKVTINNQEVMIDSNGNFSQEIKLKDNVNKLSITAISKFGKSTTQERTIFLKDNL